jgi:hypothetical protein
MSEHRYLCESGGFYVESGNDLMKLVEVVTADHDPDTWEECVFWDLASGASVVAILHVDGSLIWLVPMLQPEPTILPFPQCNGRCA